MKEKERKIGIMLTLLLAGMLTLAFNIQQVKASGTIYIRADGSIDPSIAPIQRNGDIYTLTDNITSNADGIVIERDNVILDGAGYTVLCTGAELSEGIYLEGRNNVTIKNVIIKAFWNGILLNSSSNNNIVGNTITTNNRCGVCLSYSSEYNSIVGNNITDNRNGIILSELYSKYNSIAGNNITGNGNGILLDYSSSNVIVGNNITKSSYYGIYFVHDADYNIVTGNNITKNWSGIFFDSDSDYNRVIGNNITNNGNGIYWYRRFSNDNNKFYHNNFINNTNQIDNRLEDSTVNIWDDGYPSGGNYWSDYIDKYPNATEIDDLGIWDIPCVIDENNQDNYPLMNPYTLEVVIVDNIPPEISVPIQEPSENIEAYQNVTVTVNVIDYGTGVKNVTLWYAINNSTTWIPLNMIEISTGTYQATIPGYEKDQWIQYKIIAYDNNANEAINDNHGYCYIYDVIPEFLPLLVLPMSIVTTLCVVVFRGRKNPVSIR